MIQKYFSTVTISKNHPAYDQIYAQLDEETKKQPEEQIEKQIKEQIKEQMEALFKDKLAEDREAITHCHNLLEDWDTTFSKLDPHYKREWNKQCTDFCLMEAHEGIGSRKQTALQSAVLDLKLREKLSWGAINREMILSCFAVCLHSTVLRKILPKQGRLTTNDTNREKWKQIMNAVSFKHAAKEERFKKRKETGTRKHICASSASCTQVWSRSTSPQISV